ncbi:hypothetical protein [Streptomyces sp. NPDC056069]|uniref:hypothetical protein n=1 Tax=Streptomyces sp. NPDC056069 TaxID=3345702 RepID=UPI0035DBD00D
MKGHINGVSEDVLDVAARALHLDDDERTYLFNLARAASLPAAHPGAAKPSTSRPASSGCSTP